MLSNSSLTWSAFDSNNVCWNEDDKELIGDCSPWVEFEKKCEDSGLFVKCVIISDATGKSATVLHRNCKLRCGRSYHEVRDLITGLSEQREYIWIYRDEPSCRRWTILGCGCIDEISTSLDDFQCPDPLA